MPLFAAQIPKNSETRSFKAPHPSPTCPTCPLLYFVKLPKSNKTQNLKIGFASHRSLRRQTAKNEQNAKSQKKGLHRSAPLPPPPQSLTVRRPIAIKTAEQDIQKHLVPSIPTYTPPPGRSSPPNCQKLKEQNTKSQKAVSREKTARHKFRRQLHIYLQRNTHRARQGQKQKRKRLQLHQSVFSSSLQDVTTSTTRKSVLTGSVFLQSSNVRLRKRNTPIDCTVHVSAHDRGDCIVRERVLD